VQDAFEIVLFVVVGIGAVVAIVLLLGIGRLYDDLGHGGMSIGEDRAPQDAAERAAEIRQLLEARNARRAARGEATADVERELHALTRAPASGDPEVLEEVRALVAARNARRIARGREPLDVEAEIARELRDLPG
jgi:hypothetical protein